MAIAVKIRRAGTQDKKPHAFGIKTIFPTKKLTAADLAACLNGVGISCHPADIYNDYKKARNTGFIPKQVPRNARTEMMLRSLKQELFPQLKIDEFLTDAVEDFYVKPTP